MLIKLILFLYINLNISMNYTISDCRGEYWPFCSQPLKTLVNCDTLSVNSNLWLDIVPRILFHVKNFWGFSLVTFECNEVTWLRTFGWLK